MSDPSKVQQIVEQVVSEVLQNRLAELRTEVATRVVEQLGAAGDGEGTSNATALLNSAVLSVQNSTTQTGILTSLLEGAAGFCGRVALFVLRGNSAVGWQARGFADDGFIKRFNCDPTTGLAGRAIQDRMAVSAAATEFSPELVKEAGNPVDGNAIVLPLMVRDKVPALLYVDRGAQSNGVFDSSALELLVRSAGLWLEIVSARRTSPGAGAEPEPIPEKAPEPVRPAPVAEAAAPPPPVAAAPEVKETAAPPQTAPAEEPPPPPPAEAAPAPVASASKDSAPSPQDAEVHKKAKRFAKLLVDEIRLYNQTKVSEGRQKHDLYDRLKEDIEKSRMTYDKRYGNTVAASAGYFDQELVRILANNDAALLGSNYSGS